MNEPDPMQEHANDLHKQEEDRFGKIIAVLKIASEWKVKPKPKEDRGEVVECPECKGKLHLAQSAYNGHVRGYCETKGCLSFIE